MSAYLNEIFYHKDVISKPSVLIDKMSEFMLFVNDTVVDTRQLPSDKDLVDIETVPMIDTAKIDDDFIYPKQQDTLFWCMFIIAHGYNEYMQVGRNYAVRELAEKQRVLEFTRTHRTEMKATNIRVTNVAIQEIQSELMTSQRDTSMMALVALAVYYRVNLIIMGVNQKCVMEIRTGSMDEGVHTFLIQKMARDKYKIRPENLSRTRVETILRETVSLYSFEKPLAPISSFKVDELHELYAKLGFSDTKKVGKSEMYQKIAEVCKLDS
jgi:hypothetical protein